jgi:BlaI family transcriptional regulator, penicillinase repressor
MSSLRFGKVQLRIMRVLWDKGRVNAREITDEMNKIAPIAHSTVQTLLRKLEEKGAAAHDVDDRTFIFYPLVLKENVTRFALHEFVDRVFNGSMMGMVSYLFKSEEVSPKEMEEIRKLIQKKK